MEPNKELEQAIENKFLTPSKFAIEIEKIVTEENCNYIDAICHYCEINGIDVESITKLVKLIRHIWVLRTTFLIPNMITLNIKRQEQHSHHLIKEKTNIGSRNLQESMMTKK